MGGNNKRKSRSKRQAYETLKQYRKAERNKKHDLFLQQRNEIAQIQELQMDASRGLCNAMQQNGGGSAEHLRGSELPSSTSMIPNNTVKIFDVLKDPKCAYIPYCKIPPPFRGAAFTRKRKMDAYEAATYAQALQKRYYG